MDEMIQFLAVMSALSASTQTITLQIRKRIQRLQYTPLEGENSEEQERRKDIHQVNIHLVAGAVGAALAWLAQVHPLQLLGLSPVWSHLPSWLADSLDYLTAGVLVSFGGPFFHELLGSLREYKKTLRQNQS